MPARPARRLARRRRLVLLATAGLTLPLLPLALSAHAATTTWHVAVGGNDGGSGSSEQPFASLNRAAQSAQPGDTVLVHGGTYRFTGNQYVASHGTSSARILIEAAPGEKPVLDGSRLSSPTEVLTIAGSFVDVKGLEIENASRGGISIWGGSHVSIVGNTVHGNGESGIFAGFDKAGVVTDLLIQQNKVFDNARNNAAHTADGGWSSGIAASGHTSQVTIKGNESFENHGEGIIVNGTDATVDGNSIHDNFSVNLYADHAGRSTFTRNLVYTSGKTAFDRFGMPATGIELANETSEHDAPLVGNTFTDNVVVGGHSAFAYYSSFGIGGGIRDTTIEHNTFYTGSTETVLVQADAGHRSTTVKDNVIVQTGGRKLADVAASAGLSFSGNCWSPAGADRVAGSGDVVADPQLTNPGGLTRDDYRLKAGSPCAGKGARFDGSAAPAPASAAKPGTTTAAAGPATAPTTTTSAATTSKRPARKATHRHRSRTHH